jgi:hypothetical protein
MSGTLPAQDGQLMSQGDEFQFQRGSATKPESEQGHEDEEHRDHADDVVAAAHRQVFSALGGFAHLVSGRLVRFND